MDEWTDGWIVMEEIRNLNTYCTSSGIKAKREIIMKRNKTIIYRGPYMSKYTRSLSFFFLSFYTKKNQYVNEVNKKQ